MKILKIFNYYNNKMMIIQQNNIISLLKMLQKFNNKNYY